MMIDQLEAVQIRAGVEEMNAPDQKKEPNFEPENEHRKDVDANFYASLAVIARDYKGKKEKRFKSGRQSSTDTSQKP